MKRSHVLVLKLLLLPENPILFRQHACNQLLGSQLFMVSLGVMVLEKIEVLVVNLLLLYLIYWGYRLLLLL